jgi:hypothetical protein
MGIKILVKIRLNLEEIGLLNLYRMDCENEKNIAKYIRLKVKIQCGIFGIGVKCKIKSIPPDVTRKMDNQKIDNGRYLLNVVVSKIVPNMMMNVGIKRLNKFWIIDIFMNSLLNLLK